MLGRHLSGKKKNTKINCLGPETAQWGGGLPREGVVAEKFVLSLESLSSLDFEERNLGRPGNFAGMSRTPGGVQKVCAKKVRAHFLFPNLVGFGLVVFGMALLLPCRVRKAAMQSSKNSLQSPEKFSWEESSMDQCQCRGELWKNFQDHWSIQISPGKGMDQWLVHMNFPRN